MGNKIKKLLSVLLAAAMLITAAPLAGYALSESEMLDYLTYEIRDGEVTITRCDKSFSGEMTIPSTIEYYPVTRIAEWAFYNCIGLTNINFPGSLTRIDDHAFQNCSGLTNIKIPGSVRVISFAAFVNCTSLNSLTISDGVEIIGDSAFTLCTSLKSVVIPDSVVLIHSYAFSACTELTDVIIGSGVTYISYGIFDGCNALTSIKVKEDNKAYDSRDNCNAIISTETNELFAGCKNTVIPNNVISIFELAFGGCTGLTSITIPDSVTNIRDHAFFDCTGLTSIMIPKSVTNIGSVAFGYYNQTNYQKVPNFKIYCYSGSAGEQYAIENEFDYELLDDSEPATVTDEKSGISLGIPAGAYNGDVTLKVEEVLSGSSFDIVEKISGKTHSKVFSIETYVNGESVQPNGEVTVKIPVPDGFNAEKCKLYYLNASSKNPEEIAITIEGGYIVFKTNHFSEWAIVQLAGEPTVSVDDIEMNYKKTATLNTVIGVDEGVNYTVEYSSSNPSVAKVDENGNVYGAKKGSAEITVTVTDEYGNTVTDTCNVKVNYSFGQWLIVILLFGWIWY